MRRHSCLRGFTLIETIVALLIFSVGALALAGTAALIGRELRVDYLREQATRIAASRVEVLRAGCRAATSGSEIIGGVMSQWSVTSGDSSRISVAESVSYVTWKGSRTDTYHATIRCG
jgi:prepilin-type N-terminal cleavage/methylation domain-containing protein